MLPTEDTLIHNTPPYDSSPPRSLIVGLLLAGRSCLVVGAGNVATRKLRYLLTTRAVVTVVAPKATAEVRQLAGEGRLVWLERRFENGDIEGCALVLAATDDTATNAHVLSLARRQGILAGAVDANWPDGDFIVPSQFSLPAEAGLGEATVSISTHGTSPRRARRIRQRLQAALRRLTDDRQ